MAIGGDFYYLNDGDQYARLGTTSCDEKLGLNLASQQFITIEAAKGCADRTETNCAVRLTADGTARITMSRWFYGKEYNRKHKYFAELPPQERNHYFQEAVSSVVQGARPVGDLTTRLIPIRV